MSALTLYETGPGYPSQWSPCRQYRYVLWRQWGPLPYAMVVGLNPSTADDEQDDPTIRRCVAYVKREGMGALCMTNVYAWRSTDPKGLRATGVNPVGPENGNWLAECAKDAALIVCAWGRHAAGFDVRSALSILASNNRRVMCLGKNLDGSPKHPLYLRADAPLIPMVSL